MKKATYNPAVFAAPDMEAARRIIVTPTGSLNTDKRWELETPYLAELIGEQLGLSSGKIIVDYGCGVGRIAKALVERFDCQVLGVDLSEEMRALAPTYVRSANFSVVSRRMLQGLSGSGFRADAAISVWVLQHCVKPLEDIELICEALSSDGKLTVVNNRYRAVPTVEIPWVDDGLDLADLMSRRLSLLAEGRLDAAVVSTHVAEHTYWATYRNE